MSAALDIGRLLWLGTVLALAVWLPAVMASRTRRPAMGDVIQQLVRTIAVTIVAITVLSALRLLNPLTLAIAYASWPVSAWAIRHRGSIGMRAQAAGRRLGLRVAIMVDEGTWRTAVPARLVAAERSLQTRARAFAHSDAALATLAIVLIVTFSVAPYVSAALGSARLAHPDAYGDLLAAEQLLAGESGSVAPRPLANIAAALSLVSSIAPVHLLRLMIPILGCALILTLIVTVRRITGRLGPALFAAIVLGLVGFAQADARTGANLLGDVFVLMAVYMWHEHFSAGRPTTAVAFAGTALVIVTAPVLIVIVAVAIAGMLLGRPTVLAVTGVAWMILASLAVTMKVPGLGPINAGALANVALGTALLCAGACHLAIELLGFQRRPGRLPAWATAAAIVGLATLPRSAGAQYVEYDVAAQKTLEIAGDFPKYRWMIVAPIEQFVLTYGRGWHQHLYEFVDQVAPRVATPGYRLPFKVDDVFVFVETRPFNTFGGEPPVVPFSALTDPVFRHYRSLAGRSSLEFAALNVCEQLRKRDPGASIYFENDRLRIYRFTLR